MGPQGPFIARYRKEATGGLDEVQIQAACWTASAGAASWRPGGRRSSLRSSSRTPELARALAAATTRAELEDLYLPYRPKGRTRATIARERGLEPLAELLWRQQPGGDAAALVVPSSTPSGACPTSTRVGRRPRHLRRARGRERAAARPGPAAGSPRRPPAHRGCARQARGADSVRGPLRPPGLAGVGALPPRSVARRELEAERRRAHDSVMPPRPAGRPDKKSRGDIHWMNRRGWLS
jgi:hypothetical protein